jgi:hypothetical protein
MHNMRIRPLTRKMSRPPEARGLGHPATGIRPDAGAVFGDHEIERRIGIRDGFGVAVDERKLDVVFSLQAACRRQLRLGIVDADRPGTAPRQPGRDVTGAAAELDGVEPGEVVGQDMDIRFRNVEHAPLLGAGRECPAALTVRDEVRRPVVPFGSVAPDVVRQLVDGVGCH